VWAAIPKPQALWSAAARRRFHQASLLAFCRLDCSLPEDGQRAGLAESGSKLPHSKKHGIQGCCADSLALRFRAWIQEIRVNQATH